MASHGAPATFVELGAFTGVEYSNTVMLEQCYNWKGILIEGNPRNYAKLVQSKRTAPKIHSAVCGGGDGTVRFALGGDDRAGEPTLRPSAITKKLSKRDTSEVVEVPCTSFERLMVRGGQPNGVSMLFLDVEGAEAKVLATADLSKIAVILVEAADAARHQNDVEPLLHAAGFERTRALEMSSWNPVYVRKGGPMRQHCITCAKDLKCRAAALGA
jgi:FkbM family methyltransferase